MKHWLRNSLLLLALLGAAAIPTLTKAQCNGIFPNNTACGNIGGSSNLPKPIPLSSFPAVTPGGTSGQIQYNNSGVLGGLTNAEVTSRIAVFTSTLTGAVPASGGGTLGFLRADGTFIAAVQGPATATDNAAARFDLTTGKLIQDSSLVIADTTGALSRSGGGGISIQGISAGTAAAAGNIGELLTTQLSFASRTAMTSATPLAVATMTLTPGDWDCSGNHGFETSGGGFSTEYHVEISTTAPPTLITAPNNGCTQGTHLTYIANQGQVFPNGPCRILVATNTSVYLKSYSTFTGNQTAYGFLGCRRVQ